MDDLNRDLARIFAVIAAGLIALGGFLGSLLTLLTKHLLDEGKSSHVR